MTQARGSEMSRQVTHLQMYRKNAFGGTTNTTLCNRVSNAGDDYNNTDKPEEVTCKLCLKRLKYRRAAGYYVICKVLDELAEEGILIKETRPGKFTEYEYIYSRKTDPGL
jgi:hypothetical protein